MHEAQQVAVDVPGVERHLLGSSGEQDSAVGLENSSIGPPAGSVASLGFSSVEQHIDRPQRALGPVGGRVVAAIHVRRAAGESAAAEFVVLEAVQIGVQPPRSGAFSQVNKRFHGPLQWRLRRVQQEK